GLMGQWDPKKYTVEDYGIGFVRFENGATLTLEASFAANLEKDVFNADLMGTEGGASTSPLRMFFERNQTLIDATPVFLPNVKMHKAEIRASVQTIRDDTEALGPGQRRPVVTEILAATDR